MLAALVIKNFEDFNYFLISFEEGQVSCHFEESGWSVCWGEGRTQL